MPGNNASCAACNEAGLELRLPVPGATGTAARMSAGVSNRPWALDSRDRMGVVARAPAQV